MNGELDGKTVLLTGASKGIGAATARAVLAAGGRLIAHYGSDRAGAEAAVAEAPERAHLLQADLGAPGAASRLFAEALERAGRIDVLVNNAAVMRLDGGIDAPEPRWDAVWDEAFRVDVKAPADLMRAAVRHYLGAGGGALITISSWAAYRGMANPGGLAYAAAKAAAAATTKALARAYAGQGLLAYVIAPGVVRTRMAEESAASVGGEEVVTAGLAMREWIPPEDIANLVVFLASGRCRHLNGATLDVNGASYLR